MVLQVWEKLIPFLEIHKMPQYIISPDKYYTKDREGSVIYTKENKLSQISSEDTTSSARSHETRLCSERLESSCGEDNSLILLIQSFLRLLHQGSFSPLTSVDISKY